MTQTLLDILLWFCALGCALLGGIVYVAGMLGVTMLFNVPLNNALASAGSETWARYLSSWTRWNHVRTVASMGAASLFIAAIARAN